jgi:hypothetical protein
MALMWPCCWPPSKFPAPRSSRSSAATRKPCAERAEFLERGEAARGQRRERNVFGNQQVRVGALVRAAHAAAQLVQLGKAEAVGAIDEDGVGARDIQAVFDDRRAHQNVGLTAHEFEHHGLEFLLIHLAVADDHARFRNQFVHQVGDRIDRSTRLCTRKTCPWRDISSSMARRISDSENGATTV